jgi:hypothetical protein
MLFLLACIPLRIALVLLASSVNPEKLPYLGIVLLGISLSFFYLYFTNSRLRAPEALGFTWWKDLRIIHACLFLAASIMCFKKTNLAFIPLVVDVLFGLTAFVYYRFVLKK